MPLLPRPSFPRPTGAHPVGTVSCTLTDTGRPAHLLSAESGRRLFVRLWYPAAETRGEPERLWADLKHAPGLPPPMRLLLAYLRRVKTWSWANAPYAPNAQSAAPRSLVVYSHGLVSFAAENTSLMEELASHGHIVMALQHLDQMAELQALNREQTPETRKADRALAARLKTASPAERASLARAYYESAPNTNRIAAARAADIAHALDRSAGILAHIPGADAPADAEGSAGSPADSVAAGVGARAAASLAARLTESVCLAGFSLGGTASTEFAHTDSRARAVANIDGGLFGAHIGQTIRIPYLMLCSAASEGLNDALLPTTRLTLPHTTHLNFHDIAMLLPGLRLVGAVGRAKAREVIARRNAKVRGFFWFCWVRE